MYLGVGSYKKMAYKNQHIIPEAYLKYFATNSKVKVMQLDNQYRRNIQEKGIGDKIFCAYKQGYYDFPNKRDDPILEKMFGKTESSNYETIMTRIKSNKDLGYDTKNLIINWMLMMKMRSSFFRDSFSKNIEWVEKTILILKTKSQISKAEEKDIAYKSKSVAKAIQLSAFFDDYNKILKEYFINFMYKDWSILKSNSNNFITSDNPGFSVSLSFDNFSKGINPVSSMYNLDRRNYVIHYFPLSKKYNLCLLPIFKETKKEEVEALAQTSIKIEMVDEEKTNLINEMTIQTSQKLIIANESSDLENMIDLIKEKFQ